MFFPAADTIAFTEGGVESMRITSSGSVGINTSSPTTTLTIDVKSNNYINGIDISNSNDWGYGSSINFRTIPITGGSLTTVAQVTQYFQASNRFGLVFSKYDGSLTEAMRIDSYGNVGIGTTSPAATLDVGSSINRSGAALNNIYADYRITGATTGIAGSLASRIVGIGGSTYTIPDVAVYKADPTVAQTGVTITNAYGLYIGNMADPVSGGSVTNSWGVYQTASANKNYFAGDLLVAKTTTADSTVGAVMQNSGRIAGTMAASTNATDTMTVFSTGAGLYRFYIGMGGTVYATSTTITGISDQRVKENIVDLDEGLDAVMALKPRKFDWKAGKGKDIKGDRGFIAQEFETVFPDMIEEWKDPAPEGEEPYKGVNANLIPILVKAIQEQQQIINDLKARIETLEGAK